MALKCGLIDFTDISNLVIVSYYVCIFLLTIFVYASP